MSQESTKQVTFVVQRYNPEQDGHPGLQEFSVPFSQGLTVLDGLIYIKENLDSTLTFRTSCRMGICGACGVMVNNYPHLACHTPVEALHSNTLTVKPLPNHPNIKDLVVDLTLMFQNHKAVKPYTIHQTHEVESPTAEFAQSPQELKDFLQFAYCVKCGICVAACPASAANGKLWAAGMKREEFLKTSDGKLDIKRRLKNIKIQSPNEQNSFVFWYLNLFSV